MNTHLRATMRLHELLAHKGYSKRDACTMIDATVQECLTAKSGHEEIVADMLDLELEYILPLLQPAQPLFVNAAGRYEAYPAKED